MEAVDLNRITLDADLQPRQAINEEIATEYASRIDAGTTFPPVILFLDGATYWLADGYHRWHAHKLLGLPTIPAEVRQGSKRDALRYSLAANAEHGQRRNGADMRKAYGIAVRHGLVMAADVSGVAALLNCSGRWAQELTRDARDAAQRERDEAIAEAKAAGSSNREIGRRLGIDESTVRDAGKRKSSEIPHFEPLDISKAPDWSASLAALAAVAALPDPDELFAGARAEDKREAMRHIDDAVAWMGAFARRLAGG